MNTTNPLELRNIELCNGSSDRGIELRLPPYEEFDSRNDFEFDSTQKNMSALLTFVNRRMLTDQKNKAGLRRKVSASIIDVTSGEIRHTSTFCIHIPRDEYMRVHRVVMPFDAAEIVPDHSYKVVIRDEHARRRLGEKAFNMFRLEKLGPSYEWYKAESGGVIPEWTDEICRTVCTDRTTKHNVRFTFRANFKEDPITLPELEIRIYRPYGEICTTFVKPKTDKDERDLYHAETYIISHFLSTGVYYAELLCMDYPIAGFVFGTDDAADYGVWSGRYLEAMDEYTLEKATRRLRDGLREMRCEEFGQDEDSHEDYESDNGNDDADTNSCAGTSDSEFEAYLEQFIKSEHEKLDGSVSEEDNADGPQEKAEDEEDSDCDATADGSTDETEPLISLDHLTGLKSVKEKLAVYERVVRFNKMRAESGLSHISAPLHAMFLGSSGTGKTTVAKMMGVMLRRAGVLSKGHVVVKERATLLGQNYNSEAEKTLQAIEEAQGGILFIDEAYQLFQPNDPRDPGKFVIETLLTSLADESMRDWMLILAGYPEDMRRMLNMNPGFKSRIPDSNIYVFNDFSADELMEIAENYLSRHQYTLSEEARASLAALLEADRARNDRNFGNARHVINLIQTDILPAMAVRVTSSQGTDTNALTEILGADIPSPRPLQTSGRRRIGYQI